MKPFPVLSLDAVRAEAQPWPKPRTLAGRTPPSLDLVACIPPGLEPFREFCAAVAEGLQVPHDAVPPLAVALASLGTSRAFEVQLAPDWRETAPLWFAVLMESGERKSALLRMLAQPVHDWEKQEQAYLGHSLAEYAERRRILEARVAALRRKCEKQSGPENDDLEKDALALAVELERMEPLCVPSLVSSDATPEALRDLLARNGERVGWFSAEVDAAQLLGSRYSKAGGPNFDLLLKSFTGEPVAAHRIGRDVTLDRPALVLALCVQPTALSEILRDTYARDRGLVPRLCVVAPQSRIGLRALEPERIPPELSAWWANSIQRLLDLPWPGRVVLGQDGPRRHEGPPRVITLAADARPVLTELRADLEPRLGEHGDLRPISAFASKLPGVVARLGLTFELLRNPAAEAVSAETMRAACAWAPFLLDHFRAVLGEAGASDETKTARRVLAWLKRQGRTEATAREIHRGIDGDGLRREELDPALDLLVEGEWLRELPRSGEPHPGRPPSPRYAVNPATLA